jgi:hypothetical protein
VTNVNEEQLFVQLIRVLEDALERAAATLGPNVKPPSRNHHTIEHPFQIYEDLSDLLDAARAGRLRILER